MEQVKCKSGLTGWQDKLHNVYDDFNSFQEYSLMYGIAERLGYPGAKEAWLENPTIQGSVNPSDLCVVNSQVN